MSYLGVALGLATGNLMLDIIGGKIDRAFERTFFQCGALLVHWFMNWYFL